MGIPRYWRNIPHYYEDKGKGKILTYTVLRTALSDPSKENVDVTTSKVPMVLAIIETKNKEGKTEKLTAEIVDCQPKDIKIGSEVEAVFRKIMEKGEKGIIEYGYKFRLLKE